MEQPLLGGLEVKGGWLRVELCPAPKLPCAEAHLVKSTDKLTLTAHTHTRTHTHFMVPTGEHGAGIRSAVGGGMVLTTHVYSSVNGSREGVFANIGNIG